MGTWKTLQLDVEYENESLQNEDPLAGTSKPTSGES